MYELIMNLPWNKRLEIMRTIKGWSQTVAAGKCNTYQKVYWNWETGKILPRKNNRIAIAKAFGVEECEIFGQVGKEIS